MTAPQLCQLLADFRGTMPAGGALVESKVDGYRCMFFTGIDGETRIWSRNGQPLHGADHVLHRLRAMERIAGERLFIDGEMQVDHTLAATKHWFETGHKLGGNQGTFYAFDLLTLSDWQAGGGAIPLSERKARLRELVEAVDTEVNSSWEWREGSKGADEGKRPVIVLPDTILHTPGEVELLAQCVWDRGGEGIVVKDPASLYRRNRNPAWQKVKQENMSKWRMAA